MTVRKIVDLENKNPKSVLLHTEGMFYRLYNKSAFWWHDTVKPFKLNPKFVKTINAPLVSIGFPISKWDAYKKLLHSKGISVFTDMQDGFISFEAQPLLDEGQTRDRIIKLQEEKETQNNVLELLSMDLLNMVRDFPLANKTPFEAMGFLSYLQKRIQEKQT